MPLIESTRVNLLCSIQTSGVAERESEMPVFRLDMTPAEIMEKMRGNPSDHEVEIVQKGLDKWYYIWYLRKASFCV